jgi:hypothetical protein
MSFFADFISMATSVWTCCAMRMLERDYLPIHESYGKSVVNLTLARGYLRKLIGNGKVVRWLGQRQAEVLGELQKVVDANSLEA